jgi:hypothetical protein
LCQITPFSQGSITLHNNSNEEQIEGKENEEDVDKRMKPF